MKTETSTTRIAEAIFKNTPCPFLGPAFHWEMPLCFCGGNHSENHIISPRSTCETDKNLPDLPAKEINLGCKILLHLTSYPLLLFESIWIWQCWSSWSLYIYIYWILKTHLPYKCWYRFLMSRCSWLTHRSPGILFAVHSVFMDGIWWHMLLITDLQLEKGRRYLSHFWSTKKTVDLFNLRMVFTSEILKNSAAKVRFEGHFRNHTKKRANLA